MQQTLYVLFFLATAGLFAACESLKEHDDNGNADSCTPKMGDMVIITDFNPGEGGEWINAEYKKLYVIRSQGELSKFIKPGTDGLPGINFDEHSLLLVVDRASNGIVEIKKELRAQENGKYCLFIDVFLYDTTEAPEWAVAVLVPAVPADSGVGLTLKYIR